MSREDWADYKRTIEIADGWKWTVYRNKEGVAFKRNRLCPEDYVPPPREPNATDNKTAYHREYYWNIRRKRDGRAARGFYKSQEGEPKYD